MTQLSRRDALRLAAAGAVTSVLAGCTRRGNVRPTSPAPVTTTVTTTAPAPTFDQLAGEVSGGLLRPGASGWDPDALLYNPRFDGRVTPAAIAACRTADDVAACVRFAAAGGAALRLRAGGHSYGGWSTGSGLVADLGAMSAVQVDAGARTATIGAGARLVDVYTAVGNAGLALGAGSCPTVGFTGLTLGGGVGVLAPSFGLTCDQVTGFDVVTADGTTRQVGPDADPDLFWALRGGGGGLAAVTATRVSLQPAPTIARFFLEWPLDDAATVLAAWQQWVPGVPRELWSTCKLLVDPGQRATVSVSGAWTGSGSLDSVLGGLLGSTPRPGTDQRSSAGYLATMNAEAGCAGEDAATCTANALAPATRQPFAATSSITAQPLPADGIAAIVAAVREASSVAGMVEGGASFDALGGAVAEVAPDATAFPWRKALASVQYTATWSGTAAPRDPAPFDAYVRSLRSALQPWLGTSAYVNYADPSITEFGTAYWGDNLARLKQVKQRYDPDGVFSFPQSVQT